MIRIKITILAILVLVTAVPSVAQEAAGGLPGNFLRFGASARGLAMGGAAAGLADDASSLFYNPAGMEQVRSTELLFFHAELLEGTRYEFFGFVMPMNRFGTLGICGAMLNSGGYERATLYEDLDETFDERQNSIQVSLARRLGLVSLGLTYRHVNQSISSFSGSGAGLDLSLFSRPNRYVSFGINLQNVLPPTIKLNLDQETFPLTTRAGTALHLADGKVLAVMDMVKVGSAPLGFYSGVEFWGRNSVALRTGWDTVLAGYSAGAGYRHGSWQFDYAMNDSKIGLSHRMSLTWRFGVALGVKLHADKARFSPSGERNEVELQLASQFRGRASGWELVIYDGEGTPRHSAAGKKAPPATYLWDGRDDQNRLVQTGTYRVVVVVLDEFKDPWTQEISIEIRDYDPNLKTPVRMEVN